VPRVLLASLARQEGSVHQAQLVPWDSPEPWAPQGRKGPPACAVTTDPQEESESEAPRDHPGVQVTRETPERMAPRDPMVLLVQQERRDREALWVFLVREASEACQACLDQGERQESREPQDHLERKDPPARSVWLAPTDLVAILAQMGLLVRTDPQERTASWE